MPETIEQAPTYEVAIRPPFDIGSRLVGERSWGPTLFDLIAITPGLPDDYANHGVIVWDGKVIPPHLWGYLRPKTGRVEFRMMPQGGNGGGAKQVIGLVAALALTVATAGIASGALLAGVSGSLATSIGVSAAVGQSLLAGAVGLAGSLALSALTASKAKPQTQAAAAADPLDAASASGNVLQPGGTIPYVVGTHRIFPPFICEPLVELIGDDEYVTVVAALAGPHSLTDLRVAGVAIDDADDISYELREGWTDDTALELVTRYGKSERLGIEMSTHRVSSENQQLIKTPSNPAQDCPVWHGARARRAPDEIWIHLLLPGGLATASGSTEMAVPIRLQVRQKGTTVWKNLPELHLSGSKTSQMRRAVRLKWGSAPETIPEVPSAGGWVAAYKVVPGQSALSPATTGWTADSSFSTGSGSDGLYRGVEGSTKVKNVALYQEAADIFMDATAFPPDLYEVRMMRGSAYVAASLVKSAYTYGGYVYDFFGYWLNSSVATLPVSRANLSEAILFNSIASVYNRSPVGETGRMALIAIRARNRSVTQLSTLAGAYVPKLDGSGWEVTSNPAPHYRNVLCGALNKTPLKESLVDDAGLAAWETACTAAGYTCDAILEGASTEEALETLASAGWARPYRAEIWGVIRDYDRSAELPRQVFTPRNSANFAMSKAFSRLPDGYLVTYKDKDLDYDDQVIYVPRPGGVEGAAARPEAISIVGKVTAADVIARTQFDLRQASLRNAVYALDLPPLVLLSRRGDLVGVQHRVLDAYAGQARIVSLVMSGPLIAGLVLDSDLPVLTEPDFWSVTDFWAVTDFWSIGGLTGVAIQHIDGTVTTHEVTEATGSHRTVTFATPIADDGTIEDAATAGAASGSLVCSGLFGMEYRRMIISGIEPNPDFSARVSLVDEAPDLWVA